MPSNPNTEDEQASAELETEAIAEAVQSACEAEEAAVSTDPADLEADLAAEKDRVLRLQAEMENLRSRTAREVLNERRYAPLPLIRDLLPAIDNMNRAIEAAPQSEEADQMLEGFELVRQLMVGILKQHQCTEIEALGEPFDPEIHEAILQQPSDETPANHVIQVTEAGYCLHDRVVRPAKVIVSSGPAESQSE
ncbi:MAG: nucleotide exchange factor GrpE [Planctomycetes bacterium]|nr:nucleotide exchange factor GrpE [Planctomycetota bacterium]